MVSSRFDREAVPKEALVDHIIAEALEVGDFHDDVVPPACGVDTVDVSVEDVDDWDVDVDTDGSIILTGITEGTYEVKVASASRTGPPETQYPADFETKTIPVRFKIRADWSQNSGHGEYSIRVEYA